LRRAHGCGRRSSALQTSDGFGLDVALGAMPFEAGAFERSSNVELVPGAA
jgi:hypothetical protein